MATLTMSHGLLTQKKKTQAYLWLLGERRSISLARVESQSSVVLSKRLLALDLAMMLLILNR